MISCAARRARSFVTTTRPELFVTQGLQAGERADFRLVDGVLHEL